MKKILGIAVVLGVLTSGIVFAAEMSAQNIYKLDPAHSTLGFKVKHMGISYVTGKFDKFDGQVALEGDKPVSLEGVVTVDSIDTGEPKRDGHLKSDDFFSAAKFAEIKFKSTKVTMEGDKLGVVGDLTIRDVTKTVVLQGEWGGKVAMKDASKIGLTLEGQINRQDFGLAFNKLLETGQAMVGNDVMLNIQIEANMPTAKADAPAMEKK